jgi:phosphoglycerol transferase MdoB-like AlkP superfamily enzyme
MTTGKRSFVLHELIFGHSTEWRVATGKRQLEYYDLYFNDILNQLERRGLDERTLLIIVSDHGDRAKSSNMENYRVPLLIVGSGVTPLKDDGFRTHLDI